ncbi:methyltransferase domain-containing protein [Mycolicibacterium elephantis]
MALFDTRLYSAVGARIHVVITVRRIRKAIGRRFSRARIQALTALGASASRYCPACEHHVVGFFRYGTATEWGCPSCGASPRERLMHTLLDRQILSIPFGAKVLHCAPNESRLVERLRGPASEYVPADIDPGKYRVPDIQKLDLMALTDRDRFDRIYASHVMEHVPDDVVVLENVRRALKPSGEAWLLVPIWDKPTEDGPPDLNPREREQRYGQWDHVRQYGIDFADRIRAAGLSVEIIDSGSIPSDDARRMGLSDRVFRARRES